MAKKLSQEENIHDLTDRAKLSKAKKALSEHKQRQQEPKKWVKVNSTTYIEVPKHFTKEQINERIEKLVNK